MELYLQIGRTVILTGLVGYFWFVGRQPKGVPQHEGRWLVLAGSSLIVVGSVLEVTAYFPGLSGYRHFTFGSSWYQRIPLVEVAVVTGLVVLAIGFRKWLPSVVALRQKERILKESRDLLELRVKERTAELERLNRQLEMQIEERELAEEELRSARDGLERRVSERTAELVQSNELLEREIVDRKKAEEDLLESEDKYRTLVEESFDGVFVQRGAKIAFANSGLTGMLGYGERELEGMDHWLVYHPDYQETTRSRAQARMRGEPAPSSYEVKMQRKDGTCFDGEINAKAVMFGGDPGVQVWVRDISERKRTEGALRKSEEKYRTIIESIEEGYYEVDLAGDMEFFNDSMCGITGYSRSELTGMNNRQYMDNATAQQVYGIFNGVFATKKPSETFVWEVTRKDGTKRSIESSVSLLESAEGEPRGFRGICMDVTDRKRTEEAIIRSQRIKAIADLASGVAHNFNNLLQIVTAGTQLAATDIEMGKLSKAGETLDRILESCRFGAETVRRLQGFAQIPFDEGASEEEVFDLSEISSQAFEMTKILWKDVPERAGFNVDMKLALADGCLVKGKKNELFEVAVNLIKNALEAMPDGGRVEVKTFRREDRVILRIRDAGVGIPKENLAHIFNGSWSDKDSVGMGLAISKETAKRHGGTISVDSEVGAGSTFTVELPPAEDLPEEVERPVGPARAVARRLHILVIDDVQLLLTMVEEALTGYGHMVLTALSGEEGIAIFRENPVDLVICDLGMPLMNGWAVGKTMREICSQKGIRKPPFVILTGWGDLTEGKETFSESGVDVVVKKPLDMLELLQVIEEIVPEHERTANDM